MTIKAPTIPARTGRALKWTRVKTAPRIEGNQSLIHRLAAPPLHDQRMAPRDPPADLSAGPLARAYALKTVHGLLARLSQQKLSVRYKNVIPRASANCVAMEIIKYSLSASKPEFPWGR
jgi:hypothetical protein